MKIDILDDWADTLRTLPCFDRLAGHDVTIWTDHVPDEDALAERLAGTEALVLIRERTRITAGLLDRLPRLRLISQRGVYPHIDVDACTRNGIVLSSNTTSTGPSFATAELTWALVLAAARQLPAQVASLRAGTWQAGVGDTLHGKTLGVLGFGKLGRIVAGYGRAFGMPVLVWGSERSRAAAAREGHAVADTAREVFAAADVVSLHLRLTGQTRGLVTAADLAAMKPTAVLVNTSRAGLIEPGALAAALRAGRPGRAAVDVFDVEPVTDPADDLLGAPGLIATPHIGFVTREDFEAQFADVFDQVVAFAAGDPIHVVNPEAGGRPTPVREGSADAPADAPSTDRGGRQ
ncbi:D-2-hydroxyacid dehydrogenase family protein [Nakamurella sp.]|uniref:D-2-hydroxyacid dehydrogenase family protein n=1 Tax=Nakamurella sp. TaxID=1869182 RepID=UPI003B3BE015